MANLVAVRIVTAERAAPDNFWGITRRLERITKRLLASHGFTVVYSAATVAGEDTALIVLELEEKNLPPIMGRMGPPTWAPRDRVERFLTKHINHVWVGDDGQLYSLTTRRTRDAAAVLRQRLPEAAPSSLRSLGGRIEVLEGLQAAEAVAAVGGRWAWETARATPYWLQLHVEKCMRQ